MKMSEFKTGGVIVAFALMAALFSQAAYARVAAYTEATEHFPKMLDDTPPCEKAYQEYLYVEKQLNTCTPYDEQCSRQDLYNKEKEVCDKCQNKWPGGPRPYGRIPCK